MKIVLRVPFVGASAISARIRMISDVAVVCCVGDCVGARVGVCVGDCDRYCERMMCNCSGAYATKAECLTTCSGSEEGTTGYDGILLDCLAYHAGMAATNNAHCGYASGTEAIQECADWCTHYCSLESNTSCGLYDDDSTTSCSDDCGTLSAAEPSANFHISHIDKNSTQCRIYYEHVLTPACPLRRTAYSYLVAMMGIAS